MIFRLFRDELGLAPLRERRQDIPLLASHFLQLYGRPNMSLSARLLEWLTGYDWPGNIRELENCLQRMIALSSHDLLDFPDLPTHLRNPAESAEPGLPPRLVQPLARLERDAIQEALRLTGGDRRRAAQLLGIGRTTLYRKLKEPAP